MLSVRRNPYQVEQGQVIGATLQKITENMKTSQHTDFNDDRPMTNESDSVACSNVRL